MRHRKKFNHLGRKAAHRKAMLANMASSLILHKRISTTTAKAKALRIYVEPLITKSKNDTTHSRRVVFSYLKQKEAVTELFREVSPKIANRPGGYTRILKTGNRLGDNAEMCFIELVDFNETYTTEKKTEAKKSTRRRRGKSAAKAETTETVETKAEEAVETKVEDTAEAKVEETVETKVEDTAEAKVEKTVETKAEDTAEAKSEEATDATEEKDKKEEE